MGILNLFFEDKKKEQPKKEVPTYVQPVASTNISTADYGVFAAQFAKVLEEEAQRNPQGYTKFIAMKNAMSSIAQDDIRYQAAFAGWASGGLNKVTLTDSARRFLTVIQKEMNDFLSAYKTQFEQRVNQNLVDQKIREAEQMTMKLAALNSEILTLKSQNVEMSNTLNQKRDAFMVVGKAQEQQVLDEIDKINHYIN